jgi:hypothetical protein
VSKCFWGLQTTILDPQALTCNPNLAILSYRFYLFHPSATHLIENYRRTKKAERLMARDVFRLVMGEAILPSMLAKAEGHFER